MFIYNITIKVDNSIINEWIQWQKEIHIPDILATGAFYDFRFFQLLDQDDSDGKTFVMQYFATGQKDYDQYIRLYAPILREKAIRKWGDKFIAFRTLLKSVD
jgi:hypothetical protein